MSHYFFEIRTFSLDRWCICYQIAWTIIIWKMLHNMNWNLLISQLIIAGNKVFQDYNNINLILDSNIEVLHVNITNTNWESLLKPSISSYFIQTLSLWLSNTNNFNWLTCSHVQKFLRKIQEKIIRNLTVLIEFHIFHFECACTISNKPTKALFLEYILQ